MLQITYTNNLMMIKSKYNKAWISKVKNIGGKWNASNKSWDIEKRYGKLALVALEEVYGALEEQLVTQFELECKDIQFAEKYGSDETIKCVMLDKTLEDRMEQFNEIMKDYLNEDFKAWLYDNGFFTAPASKAYHGSYIGGLFDHSYEVAKKLVELTDKLGLTWQHERSPILVGMFHDLCKIDQYIKTDNGFKWNESQSVTGHGDKSVTYLSEFMDLTEEEKLCITYHMGAFETSHWNDYGKAVGDFETVLWTHSADMYASKVMGI